MNPKKEKEVFYVFRQELDDLMLLELTKKIILIVSYITVIGGEVGEKNLLNFLEYANIDIEDEDTFDVIVRAFSFYIAGKLIKIRSENMGLAEILNDPENDVLKFGEERDFSDVIYFLNKFKEHVELEEETD